MKTVAVAGELGNAIFSEDMVYRFLLTRGERVGPQIAVVMINPSTADHDENDRTIARVVKFGDRIRCELRWDTIGIVIVNLYAVRATDPDDCFAHPRPVGGKENDDAILSACTNSDLCLCAWGNDRRAAKRAAEVKGMLIAHGVRLHRLAPKRPGDAFPRHPLYCRGDSPIEAWK